MLHLPKMASVCARILRRASVRNVWRLLHPKCKNAVLSPRSVCSHSVTVELEQGTLKGEQLCTKTGLTYYCFKGIPYAKPPVGPLRFKAPEAAEPWCGIRDGSKEGSKCVQHGFFTTDVTLGVEDCLFLNIYTPKLPDASSCSLMPVMAWIHGGAFLFGSGNKDEYGPDYLLERNVVFISFNYRLGPFGFLSLQNEDIPGNAGLKDQIMALKWIHKNITTFGGDPNCVTIFGESAGGASVHYLMLSPLSKGLFHRAIAQSGSALAPWAYTSQPREKAFRLGKLLGTDTTNDEELAKFLRGIPAEKLLEAAFSKKLFSSQERTALWLTVPFAPTKEAACGNGEGVFLPEEPMKLIVQGKFQQVPFLTGICSHEGYLLHRLLQGNNLQLEDLHLEELTPPVLRTSDELENLKLASTIKKFYFGEKCVSDKTLQNFVKMTTDFYFEYPCLAAVKSQSSVSTSQIFLYLFKFVGALGYKKILMQYEQLPGAVHGDELGYLFAVDLLRSTRDNSAADSDESKVSKTLITLWTNFSKTGNPVAAGGSDISWPPYMPEKECYLEIDKNQCVKQHLDKERMNFCERLFQKHYGWP